MTVILALMQGKKGRLTYLGTGSKIKLTNNNTLLLQIFPDQKAVNDYLAEKFASKTVDRKPYQKTEVRHIETGKIYKSASEACEALNLKKPAMSNHLNNREENPTVRGMTFERVEK